MDTPSEERGPARAGLDTPTFTRRALIAGAVAVGVVLLLALIWYAGNVLLLVFAAVLAGVFLHALSDWVRQRTGLSHGWSLALVVLLMLGAAVLFGWLFGRGLADQAAQLNERVPQAAQDARRRLEQTPWGSQLLRQLQGSGGLSRGGGSVGSALSGFFRTTFGGLVNFVVVVIVGIYLAASPGEYTGGIVRLVPPRGRKRAREVLDAIGTTLRRWLLGQIGVMTINGILTTLGLWLIGVPMAAVLGVLTGILNFIPNLGPIIAAVPALLLALMEGPDKTVYVAALFLAIQNLEGFVLTPLVQERAVSLPAAAVLVSQLLLGVLAGTLGVLLATPLAAATLVLVRKLYVEDALGERG